MHVSTLFQILFAYRPVQSVTQCSLCYAVAPCFIHSNVYMSVPISQSILPSSLPTNCKFVFYICVSIYFCFVNKFMCTLFLDSAYKNSIHLSFSRNMLLKKMNLFIFLKTSKLLSVLGSNLYDGTHPFFIFTSLSHWPGTGLSWFLVVSQTHQVCEWIPLIVCSRICTPWGQVLWLVFWVSLVLSMKSCTGWEINESSLSNTE